VTTVTCPASVTFTGGAQEVCSATATGVGGLNQSLSVSYLDNINAGTATADASYPGDANHTNSSDHKTFAIEQASSVTDVTCPAGPFTFNGSAHTPCSVSVTGAGGLNLAPTPSYANNVNAGTATASYTFAGDANHTGSNDSANFTIDQASSVTLVTCTAGTFVYTGSPFMPCSATATGAGGLNQSLTVSYADNINAGTATASASFAGDANHTGSTDSETFAIGQASSTTVVSCTAGPFTYNGLAQTPCSVQVTGAGSLNLTPAPTYANNVNAGTASASHNYAGDGNHTGSSDSKNFTIGKKDATWTTSPAGKTLGAVDPNPLTTGSGTGFLAADGVSATYGRAVGETVAGSPYPITATLSATGLLSNYQITNNGSAFSIFYASTGSCLGSPGHQVLQPLNTDGSSVVKKGSTIPVKFRVCDVNGNSVGTAGVVSGFHLVQIINGTAVANVNEEPLSTTPDAAFRWSASDQQWIFNLSTKDLSQGKTYVYRITLNDGSTIDFRFGTKQ
jgi:hypothetical protein